ncbi:MAG: hypothetical protein ACI8X3_001156 [Saprospiraceae bacterium]|jgi:hypothetical protein
MNVITRPKIEIDPELLKKLQECAQEKGQVIVHCISGGSLFYDSYIRIWKTTFLFDQHGDHVSDLVHFENITLSPKWMLIPAGTIAHFSLIFTGLPKSCSVFDLEEVIPQPGNFSAKDIKRNNADVYYVRF